MLPGCHHSAVLLLLPLPLLLQLVVLLQSVPILTVM
jgi:hypothetical protein